MKHSVFDPENDIPENHRDLSLVREDENFTWANPFVDLDLKREEPVAPDLDPELAERSLSIAATIKGPSYRR